MLFRGEHETSYRYSRPVFLEPHLVRLAPLGIASQRLEAFALEVFPAPAGRCDILDARGNPATRLWFDGLHEALTVHTRFKARTLRANPFDYLLDPAAAHLPLRFSECERAALWPYLAARGCPACGEVGRELAADCGHVPVEFLSRLTDWLYRNVRVEARQEAGVWEPARTLALSRGACRDVTLVFLEVCRQAGLPARYVSGYQAGDADQDQRDLHAWPEVYLPGAGWRGYDPTLGLAVAEAHLALCAAHHHELCMPLAGTFRGTGVTALLSHRIHLETEA
ncbi:protein containing transglutaminase-like domain, putative cysteine protease [hydrocarbon metagenome]|uniref:Protein containing transglutaminase-like domain, putative cysteine protease n=1 Tax=hydrocarbon metagenome TaxID=938273 RepID=A0A0W8G6L2_9ZZZZ